MNTLPASIEEYLRESGFASTELLCLRKLFEENELTLRQLAAKTGKSTGVLDQATKKLLRRNIVTKENLNGSAVYRLVSLAAIAAWVEEDTRQKQEMLKRRHQNFEAFLHSVQVDQGRPGMQYFEGEEGMKQAYGKLLEHGKELLHYFPVVCAVEDDPLRDFRVEHFRKRRHRGIFARCIVHNTPLGRRFQTRDPFEYRKTLLIPEDRHPITFEKVIAGDIVACFNHAEKRVCFLSFPELAETERTLFERLWKEQTDLPGLPPKEASPVPAIPITTRAFSLLREFFLSRKSIALFIVFALAAASVTFGMYRYTSRLNFLRLQDRVKSIASTAALHIDAKDLEQLREENDYNKSEWKKVVNQLRQLRMGNEHIIFAYVFRKTADDPSRLEFVADSHSLNPYANTDDDPSNDVDADNSGVIEPEGGDKLQWPGQPYPAPTPEVFQAFNGPIATAQFYEDSWGRYMSGYAPIRTADGEAVAVVAVDISPDELRTLTGKSFEPLLYFFGFFLLFVLIRLTAFNKSLFTELWQVLQMRKVLITLALCAEIAFFITLGLYYYTLNIIREEMGEKLMAIAATAASQFEPDDLDQLHLARDMKKEAYQRVFRTLNEIRDSNRDINVKWAYLLRPGTEKYTWEFIADADTNFDLPYWVDVNQDGMQTSDEVMVPPGTQNYQEFSSIGDKELALSGPLVDRMYSDDDQWGAILSASAPIAKRSGESVAIIGIDADYAEALRAHREKFNAWLWFLGALIALVAFRLLLGRVFTPFSLRS